MEPLGQLLLPDRACVARALERVEVSDAGDDPRAAVRHGDRAMPGRELSARRARAELTVAAAQPCRAAVRRHEHAPDALTTAGPDRDHAEALVSKAGRAEKAQCARAWGQWRCPPQGVASLVRRALYETPGPSSIRRPPEQPALAARVAAGVGLRGEDPQSLIA